MVNITDPALLHGFAVFMRARLGLPHPIPVPSEPVVCLVRRSGNRRILNEEEIVAALSKFVRVEVVQFDILSYREQVNILYSGGTSLIWTPLGQIKVS